MNEQGRWRRRRVLGALGVSGVGALAGCNGLQSESNSGEQEETTPTETVVFTDTPVEEKTGTATETSDDETATRVFDSGDSRGFAAALREVARNPGATLEIEPGTYRFDPARPKGAGKWRSFRPPEMEDVTIEGNGATIIFTEPKAGGFYFKGGSNITVRNLTIDFDPVPFTQGKIVDLSDDRQTAEVVLDEGYSQLTHEMFEGISAPGGSLHTIDGEFINGIRKRGRLDKYYSEITKIGERRYEVELADFCTTRGLKTGIKQLFKARRNVAAFFFYKVEGVEVSNVTIRASNGAGIVCHVCDTPTVRNCVLGPPDDSDRLLGTDADGVMFVNVISEPQIEGCRIEYGGDDPIVVQQTLTTVAGIVDDRTVRLDNWHPFVAQSGDVFRALTQTGVRKGDLPPIQEISYWRSASVGRGKPHIVTFEEPIADTLSEGDIVGNVATASHDFVVRNNRIRNIRGVLIRIAASHGVVEDNVIEGASRIGVEIECDTNDSTYAPKGGVRDVTVRNNQISRPGLNYLAGPSPSGIRIHHRTRDGTSTAGQPNRDITVEGNTIENGAHLGVEVEHAAGVQIKNNDMRNLNQLEYPDDGKYGVALNHVTNAKVTENLAAGLDESLTQFGVQHRSENITVAENRLKINGESVPARLVSWTPVRVAFNRTVSPDGTNRSLALRCFRAALVDGTGETIMETNIGSDEVGIQFGDGVYFVEQVEDESWRWMGGESGVAFLYFQETHLKQASMLRLDAKPIETGIQADITVDGRGTDQIDFDSTHRKVSEISLN